MSCHIIYYKDGAKMMRPVLTREEYLALRGSQWQKSVLQAVRSGKEKQKTKLVQMNYSCLPNEDGSLKGSTRMSNTVGMNIDHIAAADIRVTGIEQLVRYAAILLDISDERCEDFDELLLERSPKGSYWLHFAVRPSGNRRRVRLIQT